MVCAQGIDKLRKVFGDKTIEIYDAGTGFGQYSYFMAKRLFRRFLSVDVKEDWIKACGKIFFHE